MTTNPATRPAAFPDPFHSGDRIRKAREYTGMDRQTFASKVGIHRQTLASYEDGAEPKRAALISIAWVAGVNIEWLETGALPWRNEKAPTPEGEGLVHPLGLEPRTHWIFDNVIHGRFGEGVAESPEDAPENPTGQEASVVNIATRRDGQVA